jgi:hypothetical protein
LTTDDHRQLSILNNDLDSIILGESVSQTFNMSSSERPWFNGNDLNVKLAMYQLNEFRTRNGITIDHREGAGTELKLDTGLIGLSAITLNSEITQIINAMDIFNGRNTTVDFGYYQILDPVTGSRIEVTAAYHLAQDLIPHILRHGPNRPFVNQYAPIRGMIRGTFRPELDMIDYDVKERLIVERINYYYTIDEGRVVQRTVQNTRQRDASELLEETNVRVLNIFKKTMERNTRAYLYDWNDPAARKGYTDAQMEIFRPWIGTWVEDLAILFDTNQFEKRRKMMSCYAEIVFRDINKRIILHIDINRSELGMNDGGGR